MPTSSDVSVTDLFCGAGGSSQGAELAGARLFMAANHDRLALETHNANFPHANHDLCDIVARDPSYYAPTTVLIGSPSCCAHSLAKGRQRKLLNQLSLFGDKKVDPGEEKSRATMDDMLRFASKHLYLLVVVENVVDVNFWAEFPRWLDDWRKLGYEGRQLYLNSQFFGVPQSRDRFYFVAWKKGLRAPDLNFTPEAYCPRCDAEVFAVQSWKNPLKRWGKYGKRGQYTYNCPRGHGPVEPYTVPAAAAINWDLPSQRICDRGKPLQPATLARIRKGLEKFSADPFLTTERFDGSHRGMDEPMQTIMAGRAHHRLVQPFMVTLRKDSQPQTVDHPLATICAKGTHHAIAQPFLASYYSKSGLASVDVPMGTISTVDRHALVQPFLVNYYTPRLAVQKVTQPLPTLATQPRTYLAEPRSAPDLEEVYFRMLEPQEYHVGMGFKPGYIVLGNKRQKVRQYGHAVTPSVMEWIMSRCMQVL